MGRLNEKSDNGKWKQERKLRLRASSFGDSQRAKVTVIWRCLLMSNSDRKEKYCEYTPWCGVKEKMIIIKTLVVFLVSACYYTHSFRRSL